MGVTRYLSRNGRFLFRGGKPLSREYVEPPATGFYLRLVLPDGVRPVLADINLGTFTRVNTEMFSPLTVNFGSTIGFPAVALPISKPLRTAWFITEQNQGAIGGTFDQVFQNLFPSPEVKSFQGILFRVYWTSYITQINSPIQLIA